MGGHKVEIKEIALKELVPYEKNPRKNDDAVEFVANSIKEFGFKVPIVIDSNNIIVAGHTRYKAAKKLKLATAPCIVADDLTPEQIKAFRLADNKTAEIAQWDVALLDSELSDILSFDMGIFGFDLDDMDNEVLRSNEKPEVCVSETYQLGITFESESELEAAYEKFTNEGYKCRVLA